MQRVVVGTRAVEDAAWLETMAARFPGQLVVAADVRGTQVVTRGWTQTSALTIEALLRRLAPLPLGGVLVTAVHVEGQLQGIDAAVDEDSVRCRDDARHRQRRHHHAGGPAGRCARWARTPRSSAWRSTPGGSTRPPSHRSSEHDDVT